MASHLVDAEARAAMERDDYETFLAARERASSTTTSERTRTGFGLT
jgi:hypothetical protein